LPRADLAKLLLQLEAAGASRTLIELGLADQTSDIEDEQLARVLGEIAPKAAVSLMAIVSGSGDQARWRRTAVNERFARAATLTASDLALDYDAQLRHSGVNHAGLDALIPSPLWLSGLDQPTNVFRIDFGIDLKRIPTVEAEAVLSGQIAAGQFVHSNVIVGSLSSPTGYGIRVPRYGDVARPQITALATETLLLGRQLRALPPVISTAGLVAFAVLVTLWCMRLTASAGAGLLVGVFLCTLGLGAKLQGSAYVILPVAGTVTAALIGFLAAQVTIHPALQRVRHAARAVLAGIDLRLAWVLNDASDGLVTFDSKGAVLCINSAARRLFGLQGRAECKGPLLSDILGRQADAALSAVWERTPRRVQTLVRRGGSERYLELAVNAVPAEGAWIGVAIVRDITEQHAQFEALNRFATEDSLTGLLNRRAFAEALNCVGELNANEYALLMCDLDEFKTVNDTFGHQAGDAILREIAARLASAIGPTAILARLGGDEFAVLLAHTSEPAAGCAAERLLAAVCVPIAIGCQHVRVGMSIGIALSSSQPCPTRLMASADRAMYRAKVGRSGYAFAREQQAA
jgi:diguanylate cyclase (GGDEF)-like protein/PAS domain S-box-containing protein